jgi:hypothetical protein
VTLIEHDLHHPLILEAGSIAIYPEDGNKPAHSILPGQVWPGETCLPPGYYPDLEAGSRGRKIVMPEDLLAAITATLRWAIERHGPVPARVEAALRAYGPVRTQEQLARLVCARRETVSLTVGRLNTHERFQRGIGSKW